MPVYIVLQVVQILQFNVSQEILIISLSNNNNYHTYRFHGLCIIIVHAVLHYVCSIDDIYHVKLYILSMVCIVTAILANVIMLN